ncbi:hypothetical protein F4805DRAFT_132829 [Annulohypoxylon moriforme]|nr:hypothetical protein F4805DRAFT_132829 [Annulohypoxylon moriforme]
MEALVAVGLASNVLQFVDFTAKLIGISNELRNHAASSENRDHQVIATHLETLSQNISNSANAISQISATVSSEEKDLQPVANKCCELAKNLLKRLDTCGIQPGQNASRLQRAKGAFKAIWNKREIEEISSRLEYFRSELILYYAFQTRKTQLELSERQSSKDDIQPVLDKLDDLGPMIESVKRGVYDKYNVQHSELLGSIADAQSENVRLHTQAAHRGIEGQSTVLNRLEGLQASMTTLNVGVQDIRCQQSGTIESLAQARVENSTFLAGITQQVSLASNSSSTLQYALRPLLEEYKEKFIAEVKKEFRGTARSQMNNMFENALPALDEMQSLSTTIPPRYATVVSEAISETDRTDFGSQSSSELQNLDTVKKRSHGKFDKNSFTMIYHKRRWFVSDIGTLSLFIRDCVHFSASGTPTEVYELTAQFIPSPRWLSTGCSIIYKNRIDARGSPELGLRLQSYRVLDDNHEVWRAIGRDNISHIQDMLSQKIISTSDRNVDGRTLLHYAVSLGRLDICKALVQSGADINVHDCNGESIIVNALNPEKLWENGQSKDIIHYLLSLGVELEDFWSDDAPALL